MNDKKKPKKRSNQIQKIITKPRKKKKQTNAKAKLITKRNSTMQSPIASNSPPPPPPAAAAGYSSLEEKILSEFSVRYGDEFANYASVPLLEAKMEDLLQGVTQNQQESAAKREAPKIQSKNSVQKCKNCHGVDFVEDFTRAEITCLNCGTVFQENMIRDEDWTRQYEGDINPSQSGPPPDERFTSSHNLATVFTTDGSRMSKSGLKDVRKAEWEASRLERSNNDGPKRLKQDTTQAFKDDQKREVFSLLEEVCSRLSLSDVVCERAKTLFANFRQIRDYVSERNVYVCCCLISAQRKEAMSANVLWSKSKTSSSGNSNGNEDAISLKFQCKKCKVPFSNRNSLKYHKCAGAAATTAIVGTTKENNVVIKNKQDQPEEEGE